MDSYRIDWGFLCETFVGGGIVDVANGELVSDLFKLLTPPIAQTNLAVIKLALDDHENRRAVSDLSTIVPKLTVVDMIQHLLNDVLQDRPDHAPDVFADINATKIDIFVDCLLDLAMESSPTDRDEKARAHKIAVIELACYAVEVNQTNFSVTQETMVRVNAVRNIMSSRS